MLQPGTPIEMTKGYKGVKGTVIERTESHYELYVLKLENGIHLVAGPTAFIPLTKGQRNVEDPKFSVSGKK